MQDILHLEGVEWVALVGPDALAIDFEPKELQIDAAVAMWVGLDDLADGMPARMLIRTEKAVMLSHRVDEDRMLLLMADLTSNVGSLRRALQDSAERVLDLS